MLADGALKVRHTIVERHRKNVCVGDHIVQTVPVGDRPLSCKKYVLSLPLI